ncbi:MAG: HlyD family type I secretion periplasmic adaptor subunit [Victivallaceae bacterium]|nr:HlyD family type I secretion periplasmic adaptor subunit [Victivallaceae bacterium]
MFKAFIKWISGIFSYFFGSGRDENVAEFEPDSICLEKQAPPCSAQIVWFVLLVLLAIGILWASIAKVDKMVVAEGKIVTVRQNITLKPLERTTVLKVHVVPGQRVKEGQLLFTFDPTINKNELEKLREQLISFSAQRARLSAESTGSKFQYDPKTDTTGDYRLQNMIFGARQEYYREKVRGYDEIILRYKNTISLLEQSRIKYDNRQGKLRRIEGILDELNKKKITSTKELLETQVSVIGMEIQVDDLAMKITEYHHQLMVQEAEKNSFITEWKKTLVEELVTVDRNYLSVEKDIPKYEMLARFVQLRSPCEAVVHEVAPFQEGSAVREAESLITLVPLNVPVEAEVNVLAKDVGQVLVGNIARIKFDAFPFQQYGTLDGKVRYISHDAFTRGGDDATGNPRKAAEQKGSFYQVRMVVSGQFIKQGHDDAPQVIPGMRVVAEIKVGRRRIISYLINPFVKAMNESIREP